MITGYQAREIFRLDHKIRAETAAVHALQQRVDMADVKIVHLDAKDPAYAAAKAIVAWNNVTHSGMISITGLPPVPAGKDYQLWVLDPTAPAPVSGGVLKLNGTGLSLVFAAKAVQAAAPGFAISLEPAGGSASTTGAILFAVAPGS